MTIDRKTAIVVVLVFVLGYWWSSGSTPFTPAPQKDRPVLRWIMRAAKSALWLALVADPPPPDAEPQALARTRVGDDGQIMLEHRGGW